MAPRSGKTAVCMAKGEGRNVVSVTLPYNHLERGNQCDLTPVEGIIINSNTSGIHAGNLRPCESLLTVV